MSFSSIYEQKPLGSYSCGGRCNPEGFNGEDVTCRKPCPKCRVYVVTPGDFYEHEGGVLVRAWTGRGAIAVFDDHHAALKISVRRHNHPSTKSSATARYKRKSPSDPSPLGDRWERVLLRPTPDEAKSRLAYRVLRNGQIAVRDWKLPPKDVVAAIKRGLDVFVREHARQV